METILASDLRNKNSTKTIGKIYKLVARPAIICVLETVVLTEKQEAKAELAELKILRFSLGVTTKDKIPNELIRETVQVEHFDSKLERCHW